MSPNVDNNEEEAGVFIWTRRLTLLTSGLAMCAITALITWEIFSRYALHRPHVWALETNGYLMAIIVNGSLPFVWSRRAHIRVSFISDILPPISRKITDLSCLACMTIIWFTLCYALYQMALDMLQYGPEPEYLDVPYWPLAIFMALIALICGLQVVVAAIDTLKGGKTWTR